MSDDNDDIIPVYPDEAFNARERAEAASRQRESAFAHLDHLADIMDTQFTVPGTTMRFGLDPIIGLVPGLGDTISLMASLYILQQAYVYRVPRHIRARMLLNMAIDWAGGSVPVIGDLFDAAWKANRMNVDLLKKHAKL
jgi:hypothetical protein